MNKIQRLKYSFSDEHIINMIIDGVKSNGIAHMIRAAQHKEVYSLYNYMGTLGKMPSNNATRRDKAWSGESEKYVKPDRKRARDNQSDDKSGNKSDNKRDERKIDSTARGGCYNCEAGISRVSVRSRVWSARRVND